MIDTERYRKSANSSDHFTGPEVRLWVHNLCDEIDSLRAALAQQPAASGEPVAIAKIDLGFRWDGERLHHVPQLLIEFAAVPMNEPNDAKGWRDRDTLAAQIGGATAQPAPALVPLTDAQIDKVTLEQWGEQLGAMLQAHRAYARAILAAAAPDAQKEAP